MRFLINWIIKTLVILCLNWLGWLYLMDGHGNRVAGVTQTSVASAALVALVFTLITMVLFMVTFGLAVFLFVFFGGAVLGLVQHFAGGYVGTPGSWWTVLCGFIIMLASLRARSSSSD